MKSILDPTFRYIPSVSTDLRKTFARIRREQREVDTLPAEAQPAEAPVPQSNVRHIGGGK